MKCWKVKFNNRLGHVVTSLSNFDTKKEAQSSLKRLKEAEMKYRGKLSPQVKSAKVVRVCK